MSTTELEHIFEWVAIYKEGNAEKLLYQFDEDSEYYDKQWGHVPFVPIIMNKFNAEDRLLSFHLIPRGQKLSLETIPRYTVDLETGTYQINGQGVRLLPEKELGNIRLIYYFSPALVYGGDGKYKGKMIRLYKLGLQANDVNGKNYQGILRWNSEDDFITPQYKR